MTTRIVVPAHDVTEVPMRRTRTRPGDTGGEMPGEPVSVGARPDAQDELDVGG